MTNHVPDHELELYKRGAEFEVYADLPGYDPSDIEVRWHDGRLHVAAEHRERGETREFTRYLSLPQPIDADDISATFHDGVLEVHLPTADGVSRSGVDIDVVPE